MESITKLLNYIFSALNNNESVLLVKLPMLDIFKAYDCIGYKILLKLLENLFEMLEMGLVQGSSLSCLPFIVLTS